MRIVGLIPSCLPLLLPLLACEKPTPVVPDSVFGHCIYVNRFSQVEECREFRGEGWTEADAQASCDEYGVPFAPGACPYAQTQGACVLDGEPDKLVQLVIDAGDPARCANNERGCELFGGGTWVNGSVCGGDAVPDIDDVYDPENYYVPETLECREPLPGEGPGLSESGSVCTWNQISGCTEPGRRFEDYASCDVVLTQRPYASVPAPGAAQEPDARMQDPTYAAEVAWVKSELESCACVCCHKSSVAPGGAAIWDTEAPNLVGSFTDWGIAFAARAFDSSLLGSYRPEQNNGFSRFVAGVPSTDEPRMKRFFEAELEHRGLTVADFADEPPAPSVFYDQAAYEPGPCEDGEGVDAEGLVRWRGGRARYLYVLEASAENPGVPPNLDKPEGTLWRVDTIPPAIPMKTGEVSFALAPDGTKQSFPDAGAPEPLVNGESYLIYALADIGVPITRCVFTYAE